MFELLEEIIASSPEPKKRLSDSVAYRKNKRKRRNDETEASVLNDTNSIYLQTTSTNQLTGYHDLTDIYWEDDNDMDLVFVPYDIYGAEKLLEKANLQKTKKINNYDKFITDGFETATELSQKFSLKDCDKSKTLSEVLVPETQFIISETLFENLCKQNIKSEKPKVQVKQDIYDAGAGCSKFLSPIKCPSTKEQKRSTETLTVSIPGLETQFGVTESQFAKFCEEIEYKVDENCNKKLHSPKTETVNKTPTSNFTKKFISSLAQSIFDDFTELEDPSIISSLIKSKPIFDLTPKFKFRNRVLRTYSNNRTKKLNTIHRTATSINLEKIYDSDSSESSGLSVQKDEINLNIETKHDQINLETSQHVCENLLNLSTYFSDSFLVETDNKTIKKLVEKDRKWMLSYFRSRKNFKFSTSINSDEEFHGFTDSDDEHIDECMCEKNNLNINELDVDIFNELDDNRQTLLDTNFINMENNIDQQILVDSISKNGISQKIINSSKVFEQDLFKKPVKESGIGFPNEFPNNNNANPGLEIIFPEDNINDDIFNSELWQDEDLLTSIKTQNLKEREKENFNCQIQLNSKFNGEYSTTKTEILKEKSPLTLKTHNTGNQIFQGFKFASNKPVTISENALKQAKILVTEVLSDDNTNLEKENKENNLIPKKTTFKTGSDKSNDEALSYVKDFLNDIDMESFTDEFDFECETTKISPKKNSIRIDEENQYINQSSKNRLLEANNFLNGISTEITNVQTPQFVSFKSGLGKPINISGKSLIKAETFINETNKEITKELLLKNDDNFKVPAFEGFKSGKGKPIEISEKALQKATKMMEEINNEIIMENLNICDVNKLDNTIITKQGNIDSNSCQENEIPKTILENDNFSVCSEKPIEKPKSTGRKSKKNSSLNQIYTRRVTRLSSRINSTTNSTLESVKVETQKHIEVNMSKPILEDINKKLSLSDLNTTTKFISHQTENSTNSLNNLDTTICTPLSRKTSISQSQFSAITPLGTKKNNLSLSRRNFKPPATIITQSFNGNLCTPLRNLNKTSNNLETPNLKEFFNSVNGLKTSTPVIPSSQLTLTKEITPSTVAFIENEMNNSSFNNDMKMINWNQQSRNNLKEISLSGNLTNITITPSPKMRIGRLKLWNKPPSLLPLAYIDTCTPSGLKRKTSFLSKLENQNIDSLE